MLSQFGMWPKQVIARVEGGLGNQLFQYAAARSLADRLECDLLLDLRGLVENGDRPFQLDLYRIRASVANSQQLQGLPDWRSSRWGRIRANLSQFAPAFLSFPVFWPRSFAFDRRFEQISHPVYLVGYWQSEKYFAWNRPRLLQDIQLLAPLPANTPLLEEIRSTRSVALHIRRGDYVSNTAAAQFHGLCDMDYYRAAINALKARFPDIHVFVFSDEPAWARANLVLDVPTRYVDANPPDQGHIDLELMRQCRHHVIANSSFSWWGAWLCESHDQMVYAPKRWFADPDTDTTDVIPVRWIQRP
jgi:hypothetical protein